jgi:hypothetical protein
MCTPGIVSGSLPYVITSIVFCGLRACKRFASSFTYGAGGAMSGGYKGVAITTFMYRVYRIDEE